MERYQQARDQVKADIMRTVLADPKVGRAAEITRKIALEGLHDSQIEATMRELTFTGAMMDEVEDSVHRSWERGIMANCKVKAAQAYLQRGDITP